MTKKKKNKPLPPMSPKLVAHDLSMCVPDAWVDKSMQVWSAPPQSGKKVLPNVVLVRERLKPGQDFNAYVNDQLKTLMDQGENLELETREGGEFLGRPSVLLEFSWESNEKWLRQQQLYVAKEDGEVINIVFTAAKKEFGKHKPVFEQILASFTWAEGA